jgi:1-phosphofructokinase family hexose kinase
MILCVTLNPCLDKTLTVPPWQPGQMVRGSAVREVVGGKGNNVARALRRLGRDPVRPVTFLGGPLGERCERLLREADGFDPLITPTAAPTREILTVRTGDTAEQTSFFDPNPEIRPAEAEALLNRVEGALTADGVAALTLSGSSPGEATHALYSDLIALALARKVPVFLDTYGPALEGIWGFWPTAMQLNRREAGLHLKADRPGDDAVWGLLEGWARRGVACSIVTDGPAPLLAFVGGRRYRVHPPEIEVVNPVGSGDSLLAGLVDGWLAVRPPEPLLRHAVACGVANAEVWDAGSVDPDRVRVLEDEVGIEVLK